MLVKDLIAHLSLLPQEAQVVVSESGLTSTPPKWAIREGQLEGPWIVDGFTAEELRREDIGVALWEKENLVVIHLSVASDGRIME